MDKYDTLGYFLIGFVVVVSAFMYYRNSDEFQLKCIVEKTHVQRKLFIQRKF